MKYFIAIILFFATYVFAQQDACEQMHSKMLMHLKQQNVILCRVSGIEKRTDVFGFFFKFDNIPTVLLYGDTYDAMMYMVEDLKNVKCLSIISCINDAVWHISCFVGNERTCNSIIACA